MKKYLSILVFCLILLLGIIFRFTSLGSTPNSLNWDEVSWGYNAYSIEKTGMDEYGTFLPLTFPAFGDFKQPVYVYLTAISVKTFGLTPFAVRLPSAVFGVMSILILFGLVRELFAKQKYADLYGLFAMACIALSPWSIQFSRIAYEANVALAFVLAGFWTLLIGIHRNKKLPLFLGTFFLAISTYTYHSEKVITPILFAGLIMCHYRSFIKQKLLVVLLGIFFLVCCSLWLMNSQTTQRGRSVLFVSDTTRVLGRSVEEITYEQSKNLPLAKVMHNRRFIFAKQFVQNYLSHFNPEYLFLTGDQPQHHAPNMGLIYLMLLPIIGIGLFVLLKNGMSEQWFLFLWLFVAPLASSLAIDAPNASRNLLMAPVFDIFAAYGIVQAFLYIKRKKYFVLTGSIFLLLLIGNIIFFTHQYFVHTNTEVGPYMQYGYRDAVSEIKQLDNGKQNIFIADDVEQGYAFYLFYTHFDPRTYQAIARHQVGFGCRVIGHLYFGNCTKAVAKGDIYVSGKDPSKKNYVPKQQILEMNGETALTFYAVQ